MMSKQDWRDVATLAREIATPYANEQPAGHTDRLERIRLLMSAALADDDDERDTDRLVVADD